VQDQLKKVGIESIVCPDTNNFDRPSIEERAEACVNSILKRNQVFVCDDSSARNVVIFGHSTGGLVAREVAADPRVTHCIYSAVTISATHRGTALADYAIEHEQIPGDFIGSMAQFFDFRPQDHLYLTELSTERNSYPAENFLGQDIPDAAGVKYASISSSFSNNLLDSMNTFRMILANEIEKRGQGDTPYGSQNDGMVPEYSQIHGEYLGHLEVNHLEAACLPPAVLSLGCKRALQFVIPALQKQIAGTRKTIFSDR